MSDTEKTTVMQERRAKNKNSIEHSNYCYIFTFHSDVFHTRDCSLILNARSICGCRYYRTALRKRRPCKVCKPQPNNWPAKYQTESSSPWKSPFFQRGNGREIVRVKLLNGQVMNITLREIVGYCHYTHHCGEVSKKLLQDHKCLEKNCPLLEKYWANPFWMEREKLEEIKRNDQKTRKAIRREKKEAAAKEAEWLSALCGQIQVSADQLNCGLKIIRVQKERATIYKIYYVSDNRYADGMEYPELFAALSVIYPRYYFLMRHIKDIDGHYVTRAEYDKRRKK